MKTNVFNSLIIFCLLVLGVSVLASGSNTDIKLNIKLNGIIKSKISVYSIAESKNNLIKEFPVVQNGESILVEIPAKYLPGEFVILFEYSEKLASTKPQTAERMIILNKQDVNFFANPKYINNPDSSYFNTDEIENATLSEFAKTTMKNMEMLDLLQSFLLKYDNPESDFYKAGILEFSTRRLEHNNWIDKQIKENKELFCSNMFYFYYVPDVNWSGDVYERQQSLIDNYFTGMDFKNKNVLRVSYIKTWMDNYVNKYVELATSQDMISELFVQAGQKAIDKAKIGDPEFYGWMVDYFFNGYESMNIQPGITMLEQYTKDPNCKTYKRKEIEKRVTGIQTLIEGTLAPDFAFIDESSKAQNFLSYKTSAKFKLVIFWSADCEHCVGLVNQIYEWHLKNKNKIDIFALSLDESDTEISKWEVMHEKLLGLNHVLTQGGINSKEAESYFILSTPTMFLVDSKTNKILASPVDLDELIKEIK
jgi:thiol-disulfide isomerase/thioredoxin